MTAISTFLRRLAPHWLPFTMLALFLVLLDRLLDVGFKLGWFG